MNDSDEFQELTALRKDVPPVSARAHQAGRRRLLDEIAGPSPRRRGLPSRRLLLSGALAGTLAAGVAAYQIAAPHGSQTAAAADILGRAADTLSPARPLHPRPEQYVYSETTLVTGALVNRNRTWSSADGSRPGLRESHGDIDNSTTTLPPYRPGQGLLDAPYLTLARLPTDAEALLARLTRDPSVLLHKSPATRTLAVWGLMRGLVSTAPPAQQAALFRAAARLPGIRRTDTAVDIDGVTGVAVGLDDPALGRVEMVFDAVDSHYLGERVVQSDRPDQVQFSYAVRRIGVVDRPGLLPR
ncbi:CU044_5270 family protein [Streptomyces sp. NPDC004539]|uniref:CU044_5270 family protein n=1 Tax=Streptomyces sp. NPDC004539 TaxID=3154280 RepID=UPI0033B32AC2